MAGFQCPYCNMIMSVSELTLRKQTPSFFYSTNQLDKNGIPQDDSVLEISFYKCPHCHEYTIKAEGLGTSVCDIDLLLRPLSCARKFPKYIPEAIRQDYEEACAIVSLSPKASATLSRRCLQGMIRDFWKIDESNLAKAIKKLEDKIPAPQWKVLDGIRRIGNIGAHMEKDINLIVDIDTDEARKLLKLIEHLLEQWYINRHEQELLYDDIIGMDASKQAERKKLE